MIATLVVGASLAVGAGASDPAPYVLAPVAQPAPVACQEDDPCWDCSTMGNGICGAIVFEDGSVRHADGSTSCIVASPCDYAADGREWGEPHVDIDPVWGVAPS